MNPVTISTRNSKLGITIPSINLPPVTTCRKNAPCISHCYANKGHFRYKNVIKSLNNNLEVYKHNPEVYFGYIDLFLRNIPYKFFRYHSSGDIVDKNYLNCMCKLARKHKKVNFLCFTKKFELINEYISEKHNIPSNLKIVLSNWGDFLCDNPYNLPVAYVKLKKGDVKIPIGAKKCIGFCGTCVNTEGSCWKLGKGEAVYFEQH